MTVFTDGTPYVGNVALFTVDAAGNPTRLSSANPLPALSTPTVESKASAGAVYLSGTGNIALSVAGNLRLTIANPTGSGKTLYIYRLSTYSSAAGFAGLFVNPTLGLPVGVRPVNNVYVGNPTVGKGVVNADENATTALGGGTDTGVTFGIPAGNHSIFDLPPLIVPAGVTLGVNVPFTGAANATLNAYWYEV